MRKEMDVLKKKNGEEVKAMRRENKEELAALRRENTRMKQKLNEPTVQDTIEGERPPTKSTHLRTEEADSSHQENTRLISMSTLGAVSR